MAYKAKVVSNDTYTNNDKKANRDPITGEPGSHPVATGVGAAVGAAAGVVSAAAMGAATGAALGPLGAIAGAAAGGILGGGVGHGIGEDIYPTQLAWWKDNYSSRPYVNKGAEFSTYEPAYRHGIQAAVENRGKTFDSLEPNLSNNWNIARGDSTLEWDQARHASRDAFDRVTKEY